MGYTSLHEYTYGLYTKGINLVGRFGPVGSWRLAEEDHEGVQRVGDAVGARGAKIHKHKKCDSLLLKKTK